MTLKEFQAWIINHDQQDSWWVAIDGEVQDDLMVLPDVNRLKTHHPLAKISLLHVSKSEEENAEWETFESDSPSVFKVAQDKHSGLGHFKKIPSDKNEVNEAGLQKGLAGQSNNNNESKSNASDRARQFFQRQLNKEGSQSASNNPISKAELASNEEFKQLQEEVKELKKELAAMQEMMEDLKRPVSEARAMLEEREQFLEMSENSLFEKAQKQEVLQTELAQRAEDLDSRERALMQKEKALN